MQSVAVLQPAKEVMPVQLFLQVEEVLEFEPVLPIRDV